MTLGFEYFIRNSSQWKENVTIFPGCRYGQADGTERTKTKGRGLLRSSAQVASSLTVQLHPALVQTLQPLDNRVQQSQTPKKKHAYASEHAVTCLPPPTVFQAKLQTLFFSFYSYALELDVLGAYDSCI